MPDPVIQEIASAIHVRQIQTPIAMAELFTRDSRVGEVSDHMNGLQHDVTPVFANNDNPEPGGPSKPDGTLWKSDLEDMDPNTQISSVVRPLSSNVLIDGRANLLELLGRFRQRHTFLLVVGSGGLDGIVTPSDMNKQAGRTHLFMHVSALELALADSLRSAEHSEGDVLDLLSTERAGQVRSRLRRQRESDQAADLVAALDFQDLLLVEQQLGTSELGLVLIEKQIQGLSAFRNRVMHSVLNPAGDESERLDELLSQTELVERLLKVVAVAEGTDPRGPNNRSAGAKVDQQAVE